MNVRFPCPACNAPARCDLPAPPAWRCPACQHQQALSDALTPDGRLTCCAACGNADLYRKKDFPHWLGLSLLTAACALFFVFAIRFQYAIAWGILLGSAAIDALMYLYVGDAVVCYRCGAVHRGVPSRVFEPHDLGIAERYRQERLRKEQVRAGAGP